MIGIGSTNIYIDIPSLSRDELERYSKALFEEWEAYVDSHLELSDYSLSLSVEDGSVKTIGKIAVGISALYIGIGQYGSFVSGLKTIKQQVTDVSEYLGQRSVAPFSDQRISPKVQKRGEALSKLEGVFKKVENGVITTEEAMEESKAIFGEVEEAPEFFENLESTLMEVPANPSEDQLEIAFPEEEHQKLPEKQEPPKKRPKAPKNPAPPIDHYRVEVWRDSRKDRLNVRVTKA